MMKPFNRNYPFKLWINSILWSAVYLTFAFITKYGVDPGSFDLAIAMFFAAVIFGGAFSWIIFLLCYFIFQKLPHETVEQQKRIKLILCLTAIACMLGCCAFLGISFSKFSIELVIPFCFMLGILTATLVTSIIKIEEPGLNENQDEIE